MHASGPQNQLIAYSIVLRFLMVTAGLLPPQPDFIRWVAHLKLEHGVGVGIALVASGLAGVLWLLRAWQASSFQNLDPFVMMRVAIPSATAITLGVSDGVRSPLHEPCQVARPDARVLVSPVARPESSSRNR
jgi:hypothetical protein